MNQNEHISQERLVDYALKAEFGLPDETIRQIETHLAVCESCRKQHEKYARRYDRFTAECDLSDQFRKLNAKYQVQRAKRRNRYWISAAAAVFVLFISYGTAVHVMNHHFENSEIGLAEFSDDYRFAQKTVAFRDGQTKEEEGIRLFKEGVLMLLESKTTTLGLFPTYDITRVEAADRLFLQADSATMNTVLKNKISAFREKIRTIMVKKEIKK